ncbi:hypothetical protein HJG60_010777 [Phyllostomus discolor]|uniref:Uncharacterized protein n=1 Tax=Phyllostomus discolor TaxID=89673 RepID=A0A834EA65_9CHIR|nr:hypothetical protein HJG60_010777 [Phyllostomus discolor]
MECWVGPSGPSAFPPSADLEFSGPLSGTSWDGDSSETNRLTPAQGSWQGVQGLSEGRPLVSMVTVPPSLLHGKQEGVVLVYHLLPLPFLPSRPLPAQEPVPRNAHCLFSSPEAHTPPCPVDESFASPRL